VLWYVSRRAYRKVTGPPRIHLPFGSVNRGVPRPDESRTGAVFHLTLAERS
jgi:hypothetical protein